MQWCKKVGKPLVKFNVSLGRKSDGNNFLAKKKVRLYQVNIVEIFKPVLKSQSRKTEGEN